MYQQNQSDMFTNAVSILTSATLTSKDFIGSTVSTVTSAFPLSATGVAYASGGTYLGSARTTTSGPGSGVQNDATGAAFSMTTDAAGTVIGISAIVTRPDGTINNATVTAPFNPGVGPNIGAVGQKIVFDSTALSTAFNIPVASIVPANGTIEITLVAADLQQPFSGGDGSDDGIYEADKQSGAKGFGLYIGSPAAADVKVELISAPPNQTVTFVGLAPGTKLDGLCRKVYTTDAATTATNLIALY